jgi:hypothetical protein
VTGGWDEHTVTWNTRPSHDPAATSTTIIPTTWAWIQFDVKTDVEKYVTGTENHGWRIRDMAPYGSSNIPIAYFRSKEYGGGFEPWLEVDFTPPPAP